MRHALLVLALAVSAPFAVAQSETQLTVRVGVDGNAVDGIQEWQDAERAGFNAGGVPLAEPDAFPSFLGLQAEATRRVGPVRLGAHVGFGSTSGRLHYADYSGVAQADRRARRTFAGATAEVPLSPASGLVSVWATLRARLSLVRVDVARSITIGDQPPRPLEQRYGAAPYSVEPGLAVETMLGSAVVRAEAGWEHSWAAPFGTYAQPFPTDANAETGWGGYRVGLAVGTRL